MPLTPFCLLLFAILYVPAFVWSGELFTGLHHYFFWLRFDFPKPPNIIVDGFGILLCFLTNIFYHEWVILVWSVIYDEALFQPYPAPSHYLSLKANVLYELILDRSTVLDLIQLVSAIYFFQDVNGAIISIIPKRCFANDRSSVSNTLIGLG